LYRRGVDNILHCFFTHEEVKSVLNDCHNGDCGGDLSGLAISQKILRDDFFLPSIFKDCVEAVNKCHPFQVFARKIHSHPAPLHPVIIIGPFTKWGIDFMDCNPASVGGHQHIIVVMDYFTKLAEAMHIIKYDGKTKTFFIFNQIIARFRIPRDIVTDHGSHFQNEIMKDLASKLGFKHSHSSPYYPWVNGIVDVVNKSLLSPQITQSNLFI
jgi:hypothetical protein